jgi:CRISPR-associated protein Cas5h
MNYVTFSYSAKFGHFLRAEANANGVTYPVPPRTALLGLIGAILGLEKDTPQVVLAEANVAVSGALPRRFWHKTNVRKDPPAPLPFQVKAKDKGTAKDQRNFRFPQEWLWKPQFLVWAALPALHQADFTARIRDRRWHFGPSMGLSEMLADLTYLGEGTANKLPLGRHRVQTVARYEDVRVGAAVPHAEGESFTLQALRMPVSATADRVFSHRAYWAEIHGRPFSAETSKAWQCGPDVVMFL